MKDKVDWHSWKQFRGVKVWEACLLSVNADPSRIMKEFVSGFYQPQPLIFYDIFRSSFRDNNGHNEYLRRLRLVCGYLEQADSFNLVSKNESNQNLWEVHLSEFAAWTQKIGLDVPEEMRKIAAAPSSLASTNQSTDTPIVAAEKPLGNRERDNLLRVVIGMAVAGYRYDTSAAKNPAFRDIMNDLERLGIEVSDDTVRKFLRDGSALLAGRKPA